MYDVIIAKVCYHIRIALARRRRVTVKAVGTIVHGYKRRWITKTKFQILNFSYKRQKEICNTKMKKSNISRKLQETLLSKSFSHLFKIFIDKLN